MVGTSISHYKVLEKIGEGGLAWPDGHVSDGGSSGKQRDMGRDVVSD